MSLLPNALVVLFDGKRAYWGYTDETGKVILSGVPPGSYKLAVLKEGYYGYVADVVVDEDESISVTLTKPPELAGLAGYSYEVSTIPGQTLSHSIDYDLETEVS